MGPLPRSLIPRTKEIHVTPRTKEIQQSPIHRKENGTYKNTKRAPKKGKITIFIQGRKDAELTCSSAPIVTKEAFKAKSTPFGSLFLATLRRLGHPTAYQMQHGRFPGWLRNEMWITLSGSTRLCILNSVEVACRFVFGSSSSGARLLRDEGYASCFGTDDTVTLIPQSLYVIEGPLRKDNISIKAPELTNIPLVSPLHPRSIPTLSPFESRIGSIE
jgi:hypothetical protein